jgi:hypothetical protein
LEVYEETFVEKNICNKCDFIKNMAGLKIHDKAKISSQKKKLSWKESQE